MTYSAPADERSSRGYSRNLLSWAVVLRAMNWLALWLVAVVSASAQTPTLIPDAKGVTAEEIETAIEAVGVREGLDETTRNKVQDQLRQALGHLRSRQSAEAAAAAFGAAIRSAPEETQRLLQKLDEGATLEPTAESLGIDEQTPSSVLEGKLASALVELAASEAKMFSLEAEAAVQADRPAQIRERLAELRGVQGAPSSVEPPVSEAQVLSDARRLTKGIEERTREAELQSLEQELLSHGVRLNLIGAQRDDTAREIGDLRRRVEVLQAAVNARRQRLADQAREEAALAELAAVDEHPAVRRLAEENAGLTKELSAIAAEIQQITEELGKVEAQAREIEQSLARALQRLDLGGVNQLLGRLLVEQQRSLPRASRQHAEMRERRRTLAEASLAQIESEERRRELTPIDGSVERVMEQIDDVSDPEEVQSIRAKIQLLLRNRRELLQQMANSYSSQVNALNEVDLAQIRLLDAASDYERFLDRNLLWIPSANSFGVEEVRRLVPAIFWVVEPASWVAVLDRLGRALRHDLAGALGALFALGLALYVHRRLAAGVRPGGGVQASTDRMGQTLGALALVALQALPLPFLMAALAWVLHRSPRVDDFTAAVGAALAAAAPFLYNTLLLQALGAEDGVLRGHFGWQKWRLTLLGRQANRLTTVGVPLTFASALAYSAPFTAHRESLGRFAFVLLMLLVSGVVYALLHPTRGLAASSVDEGRASSLLRLGHALGVGAPLFLALASVAGYTYTALTLAGHLIDTYWLGLGLYFSRLVARRWLALAGRGIARKEQESDDLPKSSTFDAAGENLALTHPLPDLETVDRQSKRLLDAGFAFVALLIGWTLWAHVVPALGVLDRTSLWSQTVLVDGEEAIVPVTLADLLLALLVAGVTVIAARNLPGLIEIAFLKRAMLQPGSRYAINTLLRYVIVLAGTVTTFSAIGWTWSQIQWLVAAISVGLGFGLQEIVANFVSGLVILFERPVRVGDTVTVGQVTGTISRIRIRATAITDWDRKEILVPNKSLITEQVINWTLTDPMTRIVLSVGIAYGSDVVRAREIMTQTLHRLPLVLDEPSPQVYFTGFGESSLDFKLHVYARQLADRLPLIHTVHEEILRTLGEHGIEIPFPQRDLYVKSWDNSAEGE